MAFWNKWFDKKLVLTPEQVPVENKKIGEHIFAEVANAVSANQTYNIGQDGKPIFENVGPINLSKIENDNGKYVIQVIIADKDGHLKGQNNILLVTVDMANAIITTASQYGPNEKFPLSKEKDYLGASEYIKSRIQNFSLKNMPTKK